MHLSFAREESSNVVRETASRVGGVDCNGTNGRWEAMTKMSGVSNSIQLFQKLPSSNS